MAYFLIFLIGILTGAMGALLIAGSFKKSDDNEV